MGESIEKRGGTFSWRFWVFYVTNVSSVVAIVEPASSSEAKREDARLPPN